MAKCIRCGKSTLVRGHVKLEDGAICTPCWKKLGFKITETASASIYRYEDIKDGKDHVYEAMQRRKAKHQQWLEDHPDAASFFETLEELQEPDENETDENEDDETE